MKMAVFRAKKEVCKIVDNMSHDLIHISQKIFYAPEVKFMERKASGWLCEKLEEEGFFVERGIADLETAFRATYPTKLRGPTVAILSEYDALPQIGHACGHNLIAAAGLGAVLAIGRLRCELPGRLQLVGTPAEESGRGKVTMVNEGVFKEVSGAMMFHPFDKTVVGGGTLGVSCLTVRYHGKSAHAAQAPEEGTNALRAAILTFNNIDALREHMRDDARIHGIITKGGERASIVPGYAEAEFQIRALDDEYREFLLQRVKKCVEAAGIATSTTSECKMEGESKCVVSNPVLAKVFSDNLTILGEIVESSRDVMVSTDMGNVSQEVPSIHPFIRIVDERLPLHTERFAQAANSERGYSGMLLAAKALAMTALDLFFKPELISAMWDELRNQKEGLEGHSGGSDHGGKQSSLSQRRPQ